jgi:hypothetical protein
VECLGQGNYRLVRLTKQPHQSNWITTPDAENKCLEWKSEGKGIISPRESRGRRLEPLMILQYAPPSPTAQPA